MTDSTYVGSENIGPDGYLKPTRYRVTALCGRCNQQFSWVTTNPGGPDRACTRKACKDAAYREQVMREAANMARIIDEKRPPGHIGKSITVKAVDETARVVMEDYGMTDLKDNIRHGEAIAPKLPAAAQAAADGFFNGQAVKGRAGMRNEKQAQLLGRRAIAGAFRHMAVHPGQVLTGSQGDSALRLIGTEKLKDG